MNRLIRRVVDKMSHEIELGLKQIGQLKDSLDSNLSSVAKRKTNGPQYVLVDKGKQKFTQKPAFKTRSSSGKSSTLMTLKERDAQNSSLEHNE